MTVITIEYQMGCGGRDIGHMLARHMQLTYMDREIVQGVAQELHISEDAAEQHDERVEGALMRMLTLLSLSGDMAWMTHEDQAGAIVDEQVYHSTTTRVIRAAAERDQVVIVGHGAGFALARHPGVLRVGLYAPAEQRIATVMARNQIDRAAAQQRITQSDQERCRYIKRFYQTNWREPDHYDLMLNSALFPAEQVAELIAWTWQTSHPAPVGSP